MNIDKLQAGRELDALVAEKVMGYEWRRFKAAHSRRIVRKLCKPGAWIFENREQANGDEPLADNWLSGVLHFSRNPPSAWKIVNRLIENEWCFGLSYTPGAQFGASFCAEMTDTGYETFHKSHAETPELVICRAALKAVMEQ